MNMSPQKQALNQYRSRLEQRGIARFEVLGRSGDRQLIRSLAKRLAGDEAEASSVRTTISMIVLGEPPKKGGILNALRRSPMVGADLHLERPAISGRNVEL